MVSRFRYLLKKGVLLVFIALSLVACGQAPTTEGRDFWVSFLRNLTVSDSSLSLLVSGKNAASGTVTFPDGRLPISFSVTPGRVTKVVIPVVYMPLSNSVGGVINTGIHVTTTQPVSLYASNYHVATYDNTNVLPTASLSNHYFLQMHYSNLYPNVFGVVATADSTVVYVNRLSHSAGVAVPGDTTTVVLGRGQMYYVETHDDVSGTEVWTDDCRKPVAVFAGNVCAEINDGYCCCDHIYEQVVPLMFWGRTFVLTRSMQRTLDVFHVMALEDGTHISWGSHNAILQPRVPYELQLGGSDPEAVLLTSDKRVSVFEYFTGYEMGGLMGDPSATVVHPVEEMLPMVTFATFNTGLSQMHYVNVATLSEYRNDIYLDDTLMTDFAPVPSANNYYYARHRVSGGSHTLSSPHGGFVAHIYGLGEAESYAYSVGATLDAINPQVFINGMPYKFLDSTNSCLCMFDELVMSVSCMDPENTAVVWDFGDGGSAVGVTARHRYVEPGDYTVVVSFGYVDECGKSWSQRLSFPVRILRRGWSQTDTAVCDDVCVWSGMTYDRVGDYSLTLPVEDICDSLAELHISAIGLRPKPVLSYEYDCVSQRCSIFNMGSGDKYEWSSMPDNAELNGHRTDSMLWVSPDVPRRYVLKCFAASDSSCYDTASIYLPELPPVRARIHASSTVVTVDNNDVTLSDYSVNNDARRWYVLDADCGGAPSWVYEYPVGHDSVVVMLEAYRNETVCHDTARLTLYLHRDNVWVPNVISPSWAGNASFLVAGTNLLDGEIWIYDRRGQLVWHTTDVHASWDATCEGRDVPQGTYVYTLRYRYADEPEIWLKKTGTVTVVR